MKMTTFVLIISLLLFDVIVLIYLISTLDQSKNGNDSSFYYNLGIIRILIVIAAGMALVYLLINELASRQVNELASRQGE